VLLLYDNDAPGIQAGNKIAAQHNIPLFFMPEGSKDASDFVELYGKDALTQYITEAYDTYSNHSQLGS
jgi:DNA primase